MKIFAYLLITISVITGSLASSTAYLVRLDRASPETLSALNLGSPAGTYEPSSADAEFVERLNAVRTQLDAEGIADENPLKPDSTPRQAVEVPEVVTAPTGESQLRNREALKPVAHAGDRLVPELVALLKESGVTYVRVTEFSLLRWSYAWLFGLSCLGLFVGAFLVRRAVRLELAQSESRADTQEHEATDAPTVFARLSGRLHTLADELNQNQDESARLEAILLHIGQIQRNDVPAFVADKAALINRLSLAGYAELMDSFAAMERQLNRAWSAAADSHLPESEACLQNAQPLLIMTLERLRIN
jgi:hypothetical protein